MILLYVMIAGAFGSGARYLIGVTFPHGTLIVNLAGSFALAAIVQLGTAGNWSPEVRATIAIGFLGGFTTYSSFNQETLVMLTSGASAAALMNIAVTVVGCLAAGGLGMLTARLVTG